MAKFGPAGNAADYPYKTSLKAPEWLSALGLSAYEYQCGRGVHIGEQTARELGEAARRANIRLSLHAPYFISLTNPDPARTEQTIGYLVQSAQAADQMGASRIIVHCGGLMGQTREEALRQTMCGLSKALSVLDSHGLSHITLCIETMGRKNVLGTTEEVCRICTLDERLLPCIDFGHINARTNGALDSTEAFLREIDTMEEILGFGRVKYFHIHFSRIEYGASGEIRHLCYDDERYGPDFSHAAQALCARGYDPTVICESAGTQAQDALRFRDIWNSFERR